MTAEEFIVLYRLESREITRLGQNAFNLLREYRPDLAEEVRGSYADPFCLDERLSEFEKFIRENWHSMGIVS